jgi:hypothetical protein
MLPLEDAKELEQYVAAICEILQPYISERQVDPLYHLALSAMIDIVHDLRGDTEARSLVLNYKDSDLLDIH